MEKNSILEKNRGNLLKRSWVESSIKSVEIQPKQVSCATGFVEMPYSMLASTMDGANPFEATLADIEKN